MKKDYIMDRNLSYKNQNTEKVKKRKQILMNYSSWIL